MFKEIVDLLFTLFVMASIASLVFRINWRCLFHIHQWQKWHTEKTVDDHDLQHRECLICGREERHWVEPDNDIAHKQVGV